MVPGGAARHPAQVWSCGEKGANVRVPGALPCGVCPACLFLSRRGAGCSSPAAREGLGPEGTHVHPALPPPCLSLASSLWTAEAALRPCRGTRRRTRTVGPTGGPPCPHPPLIGSASGTGSGGAGGARGAAFPAFQELQGRPEGLLHSPWSALRGSHGRGLREEAPGGLGGERQGPPPLALGPVAHPCSPAPEMACPCPCPCPTPHHAPACPAPSWKAEAGT